MASQTPDQEPSIEEILNSIRQIISDEDGDAAAPVPEPVDVSAAPIPAPAHEPVESGDIIELTERLMADVPPEPVFMPDPEPAPEPEPIEIAMQDAAEEFFSEPVEDEPAYAPEPPPIRRAAPAMDTDADSVLSGRAEAAALKGFAELARKTAVEHGGITLEDIVRTELKPMLREWLDRNLPPIIERLVGEELERVAKRALEE